MPEEVVGDTTRKEIDMSWDRWLELVQTGGYDLPVWGSYLVLPALVLIEPVILRLRKREILVHLGWRRDDGKR